MGFIKDIISARRYRQKESVTADEFLKAMECDFRRTLDPQSAFFFRHHEITVNLVNQMLAGRLKQSGDERKDSLVIQAIVAEIIEYSPNVSTLNLDSKNIIGDLLAEFSKTYKDAGNIVAQALLVFWGLK